MMPDHLIGHVADKSVDYFHRVLQPTRSLDRKPGAHHDEKDRQQQHHQNFHGNRIRDRSRRIFWMNVQLQEQRQHRRAKQTIQ